MSRHDLTRVLVLALLVGVPLGVLQRVGEWGPWTMLIVTAVAMLAVGWVAWHAERRPRGGPTGASRRGVGNGRGAAVS